MARFGDTGSYSPDNVKIILHSENSIEKQLSFEARARVSAALRERKISAKTKAKLSAAKKGKNHPMFGKFHSLETRTKMSDARKGKRFSPEHRAKMSAAQMGNQNARR